MIFKVLPSSTLTSKKQQTKEEKVNLESVEVAALQIPFANRQHLIPPFVCTILFFSLHLINQEHFKKVVHEWSPAGQVSPKTLADT